MSCCSMQKHWPSLQPNLPEDTLSGIRRGIAIAYLRYLSKYMEEEVETRRARRGMWQGECIEPERWRHRQ
jgi:hypothetical protein